MKEKIKSISDLFLETEERFGLKGACKVFEIITETLPTKQYYSVKGLYNYSKRIADSLYGSREEFKKIKEFDKQYGLM